MAPTQGINLDSILSVHFPKLFTNPFLLWFSKGNMLFIDILVGNNLVNQQTDMLISLLFVLKGKGLFTLITTKNTV